MDAKLGDISYNTFSTLVITLYIYIYIYIYIYEQFFLNLKNLI